MVKKSRYVSETAGVDESGIPKGNVSGTDRIVEDGGTKATVPGQKWQTSIKI
jgi:hypothetical protein